MQYSIFKVNLEVVFFVDRVFTKKHVGVVVFYYYFLTNAPMIKVLMICAV